MNRVYFSDNGTLTEHTSSLINKGNNVDLVMVAAEDAIYISSPLPLRSLNFNVSTGNDTATSLGVAFWNGSEFKSVVNVLDETIYFTESGRLTWTTGKNDSWQMEDTEDITELSTLYVYDQYWIKITVADDCTFSLDYINNIFSDDVSLFMEYPGLNSSSALTAFATGKTDWADQHKIASDLIINDLINRGRIEKAAQLLEPSELKLLSHPKVAELVYRGLDDADLALSSNEEYSKRLKSIPLIVDANKDGKVDLEESQNTKVEIWMTR